MATIDYKERYENLVEAVKKLQEANPSDEGIQNWVKDNVPELAESEDEKTRKYIVKVVHEWWVRCNDPSPDFPNEEKMLAYLEKQGEQNPVEWSEEDYNFIKELCDILASISKDGYVGKYYTVDLVEKLKSLRPQNIWKPNEEHNY